MFLFRRREPLKDFKPESGTLNGYSYGANSITGWRNSQEDRLVCLPNFTENLSFFAVYDGHGGEEVAEYLKRNLHHHVLEKLKKDGDIKKALSEAFKSCDEIIKHLKQEEFSEIKNATVKEFKISDIVSPETSNNSSSSINDDFMSEVKNEIFKHILKMQVDSSTVTSVVDNKENKDNNDDAFCEAKNEDAESSVCSTSSDESAENTEVVNTSDEKKVVEEDTPLVGLSCGSTATVVILKGDTVFVAHVGDSRCIAGVNRRALVLTTDHRPTDMDEYQRIKKAGHKVTRDGRINGGLNMSRAFGDYALKIKTEDNYYQAVIVKPTVKVFDVTPDLEYIIIASDGIWNSLGNQAVINNLLKHVHLPLQEICTQIFEKVLSKRRDGSTQDNLSMIILKKELKDKKIKKIKR